MKIRRIIARRVKSILNLDHLLYDDWTGQVANGLMVIGPNGSGKSTLLQGIAALWQAWGDWLEGAQAGRLVTLSSGNETSASPERRVPTNLAKDFPIFGEPNFGLLAIELIDLDPKRPLWLAVGGVDEVTDLKSAEPDAYVVATVGQRRLSDRRLSGWALDWPGAPRDYSWLSAWAEQRQRGLLGVTEQPNLLYFEPDNRQLLAPSGSLDRARDLQDPPLYNWIARYEPSMRRSGSLTSMLFSMQYTDTSALTTILEDINTYLRGKRLGGFAPSGDLEVTINPGIGDQIRHLIYGLSSGERQVFILLAMLRRWMHRGGLVLIDEPELHLHPSLREALLARVQQIVRERNGQLIITSQSIRLWRQFDRPPERIELGDLQEVQE